MNEFTYLIVRLAIVLIGVLQFGMLVRAILSLFPGAGENKLGDFIYALTEPFIVPMRALLDRLSLFQGFPLDMAFFFTYLLLSLLSIFLGGL